MARHIREAKSGPGALRTVAAGGYTEIGLKNEQRFLFTAAGHAQRAADYLHGLQPQATLKERAAA